MTKPSTSFRILNIQALVNDFKQHKIDESLKFKYLLAEFILLMLGGSLSVQLPPEDGMTWLLITILLMGVLIVGTVYSFKKNQQGDNVDFTARYIAVNFVVSMRFVLAYFGVIAVLVLFYPLLENTAFISALGVDTVLNTTIMVIVLGLYYYFVAKYIGQIAEVVTPTKDAPKNT